MSTDFVDLAKENLHEHLERSGSVLFSSWDTLRPGRIYLLGYNPGGNPHKHSPLRKHLENLPERRDNAYLDEIWEGEKGEGEGTLQKRVRFLLESLGENPADVCASNLIFVRSKNAQEVRHKLAEVCWPVHSQILEIVRPELILAFGNGERYSTYSFLRKKLGGRENEVTTNSGHGNWKCKAFSVEARLTGESQHPRRLAVVGLPHLSRYKIDSHPEVIRWIGDFVGWDLS